jgi:hypothetical protein
VNWDLIFGGGIAGKIKPLKDIDVRTLKILHEQNIPKAFAISLPLILML